MIYQKERWANQYYEGTEWSFLWGAFTVEYEFSKGECKFGPSLLIQFGGDQVFLHSLSFNGRHLSISLFPSSK